MEGHRLFVAWYRCVCDSQQHAVTDEEFAAGPLRHQGCYRSVCGHEVVVDSALTGPSAACSGCRRHLCVRAALSRVSGQHQKPGPSRWLRLLPSHRRGPVRHVAAEPRTVAERPDGSSVKARCMNHV